MEFNIPPYFSDITCIEFSEDERLLLIGGSLIYEADEQPSLLVIDIKTGKTVAEISGPKWGIVTAKFLDADRIIFGGARRFIPTVKTSEDDPRIWVWSLKAKKALRVFGDTPHLTDLDVSQDLKTVVLSYRYDLSDGEIGSFNSERSIQLWDIETGLFKKQMGDFASGIRKVKFVDNDTSLIAQVSLMVWSAGDSKGKRAPGTLLRKINLLTETIEECICPEFYWDADLYGDANLSALASSKYWVFNAGIHELGSAKSKATFTGQAGEVLDIHPLSGLFLISSRQWGGERGDPQTDLKFELRELESLKKVQTFLEGDAGYMAKGGKIGKISHTGKYVAYHAWNVVKIQTL